MVKNSSTIVWFRQDLRLRDNPALYEAAQKGSVLPVYILDEENAGDYAPGGASKVWLHHALDNLNKDLGGNLILLKGKAEEILPEFVDKSQAHAIFWNRCFEPWRIERDKKIKNELNIRVESFNGSLLWAPWEVLKDDGTPYRVFSPFYYKSCLKSPEPRKPLEAPKIDFAPTPKGCDVNLNELGLLPNKDWHESIIKDWDISEKGAQEQLDHFLEYGLHGYGKGRDVPSQDNVSRLSPYLHFGQISPNDLWYAASQKGEAEGWIKDTDKFKAELGWREFSNTLLYYFPELPRKNLNSKFDKFPWVQNKEHLKAWQKGMTGYPIIDAGMRELFATGYMHNRVRMVVASFLVKHLLIHWHEGERWFWDTLFDADLANNSASWQWVAGCGADAAPYFRIFNPMTQGERFDKEGNYVRKWVQEIKDLPDKYIHQPWEADEATLKKAGIKLGEDYPEPIINHPQARQRALDAYEKIKG